MGGLRARTDQRGGGCDTPLWAAIADEADYRLAALARALSGHVPDDQAGCAGDGGDPTAATTGLMEPGAVAGLAGEALTVRDACIAGGFPNAAAMAAALADGMVELAEVPPRTRPERVAGLLSMVDAFGPVLACLRVGRDAGRPPVPPAGPAGTGPTLLVVEGAVGLRQRQRDVLEGAGYAVRTAADGLGALALLRGAAVDVVLVAADMPGMSGIDLTLAIRRTPGLEHLGIIVLGARVTDELRRRAGQAGADGLVLRSALAERELLGAVARVLHPPQWPAGVATASAGSEATRWRHGAA